MKVSEIVEIYVKSKRELENTEEKEVGVILRKIDIAYRLLAGCHAEVEVPLHLRPFP